MVCSEFILLAVFAFAQAALILCFICAFILVDLFYHSDDY